MKVLVTGGTGFVGSEIVGQLKDLPDVAVRLLARNPKRRPVETLAAGGNVEISEGDILDQESLRKFCTEADAVIHLVGIISECGASTFEQIHATGTRNVLDAARGAGIRRFIHMSALGTRPQAVARYHRSKWEGEEAVRRSGLDYTIFRPSIIYGPGDLFTNLFARMTAWSPVIPVMGSGEGTLQPIPVEVVARAFVAAVRCPEAIGKTFDLAGPELLTMNEVLDAILEVTGRTRLKLHWPLPLARALAAVLETVYPAVLRRPPPLNRDQITMLQEKTTGDPRPAAELFDLQAPRFREGLRRYLSPAGGAASG